MTRRKQKLSWAKTRTAWLAWAAWGVVGGIFMFEDTQGGTGWFTGLMTAPFWVIFALWPVLWLWLRHRGRVDPTFVAIDDDIKAGDVTARLLEKESVRYMERDALESVFGIQAAVTTVTLPGGDEAFVRLEDVRPLASQGSSLAAWLAAVDAIPSP